MWTKPIFYETKRQSVMYSPLMKALLKGTMLLVTMILFAGCKEKSSETQKETVVTETATSSDGVSISYEEYGTGSPTLVFIHGWSCDRSYWEGQKPFSQTFRMVTVDLAGHGESGLGREAWAIESYGADVAAVVKNLDLEEVILVGHSMGGDVAVAAAPLLADRVAGLVWVDTYRELGSPSTAEQVQEFLEPFRTNFKKYTYTFVRENLFLPNSEEDLVERVAKDMASAPREVALQSLESSLTFGRAITQSLQEIQVPLVAINPDDGTTDIASMERHGVEVVPMASVGHFMMIENPEGFNTLLSEVIKKFVQKDSDNTHSSN